MKKIALLCLINLISFLNYGSHLLIPMDDTQSNHLKAYGIAYWILQDENEINWLLNYRGGSFMIKYQQSYENELIIRGVSYEVISDAESTAIIKLISSPSNNKDVMHLNKFPKIAVYSPKSKLPWDDAVTLVLTYAEIPYEVIFDDEVMENKLPEFDWLHLHHEDFTGQYGKFYRSHRNMPWYIKQKVEFKESAKKHGFNKVSNLKLAVVKKIKEFVIGGGFLFAMCSATDTFDIALAGDGVDMIDHMYDGDPPDLDAQSKIKFDHTLAFKDFELVMDPYQYEFSNIDNNYAERNLREDNDFFSLFEFSAKWDPIPTMLTQNHQKVIKGFYGQTTGYKKHFIKSDVVVMGENKSISEAKYIHGVYGKGFWTFYGGHDPEDYQHLVNEEPTDLNLHPNSAGYRLILNNILFPAAKKKKRKT